MLEPRRIFALVLVAALSGARADVLAEWSGIAAAKLQEGPVELGVDRAATIHVAMLEAILAVEGGYKSWLRAPLPKPEGKILVEAAAAAAAHTVLITYFPKSKPELDENLKRSLAECTDTAARDRSTALGRAAAAAVLAARGDSGFSAPAKWTPPPEKAGVFQVATEPVGTRYPEAKPWFLAKASQFRPGPPPKLNSETFLRDVAEVRTKGAANSRERTERETGSVFFWDYLAMPRWALAISALTAAPGRTLLQNARVWALSSTVATDATIAVFEAKYHYLFWRPIAAIRAQTDASWEPLIWTPAHPEYPCAHCIATSALASVLKAEFGDAPLREIAFIGPTRTGPRTYQTWQQMIDEVQDGRVFGGIHYRNSGRVGAEMGKQVAAHELKVAWPKETRK